MNSNPVIFAAIDGLSSFALDRTNCPNLTALKQRSAYTLQASSIMPSITLPCFTSIFHSIPSGRHGIVNNTWVPMARPVDGLVEVAHAAGKRCAFFHNWEPLRNLNQPLNLAFCYFNDNLEDGPDADFDIVEQALYFMPRRDWDFAFVYLGTLDLMGHRQGFMTQVYLDHLEHLDKAVGMLVEALPADATLLLTADHGGHARTHGTDSPDDMVIPFWLSGPQIRSNYELKSPVNLLDIAPTVARLLHIPPHREWEGRCIDEAFIQ